MLLTVVGLAVNNRLILREKEEKESALAHVVKEKERADRNLSRAREAVKEYLLRTSENPLLTSADFQGLRKQLLETAIPFYEEFVRQDQENPDLELERGRAFEDLGFLREGIGDQERALADYEEAKDIFRRLAASYPDSSVYRLRLAEAFNGKGGVLRDLGRLDAAEGEFREGINVMDRLLNERPGASASLESLARLQGNLGLLFKDSGRLPQAESMLREAVATREKLLAQNPDSLPLRGQLAHSWNNLGSLFRALRRAKEAEGAFEKVLEILDPEAVKRITGGSPEPAKYQHQRGMAWNNLGIMRNAAGRLDDAEQALRQALAIKERLADTFSSVPQYRQELAASFNNLGTVLTALNRLDEGQTAYQKAIHLYERLAADSQGGTPYVVELAGSYSNMGRMVGDQGQLEQSLPWLTKSIEVLERALSRDERVTKVRESLCIASWTRAMTLAGLGRYSQALADWDRALEMDDGGYQGQLRLRRASNLLQLGDHVRAVADAAALAESPARTAEDLYNVACIYALASRLTSGEGSRSSTYAENAVESLRQAMARGYRDLAHLQKDPDLEGLRSREDFQQFVKDLAAVSGGTRDPVQSPH
jgi:tetratricopeptide (TPR) repeat protein